MWWIPLVAIGAIVLRDNLQLSRIYAQVRLATMKQNGTTDAVAVKKTMRGPVLAQRTSTPC